MFCAWLALGHKAVAVFMRTDRLWRVLKLHIIYITVANSCRQVHILQVCTQILRNPYWGVSNPPHHPPPIFYTQQGDISRPCLETFVPCLKKCGSTTPSRDLQREDLHKLVSHRHKAFPKYHFATTKHIRMYALTIRGWQQHPTTCNESKSNQIAFCVSLRLFPVDCKTSR